MHMHTSRAYAIFQNFSISWPTGYMIIDDGSFVDCFGVLLTSAENFTTVAGDEGASLLSAGNDGASLLSAGNNDGGDVRPRGDTDPARKPSVVVGRAPTSYETPLRCAKTLPWRPRTRRVP